jgi:hypothetical protein
MTLHSLSGAVALAIAATSPLVGCSRAAGDTSPLPNVASIVPPATAPAPSFSLPTGGAASGGGGGAVAGPNSHGAETSPSTATGPSNNSAAVGGLAGGQATGGGSSGKPAPTAGDGTPPK